MTCVPSQRFEHVQGLRRRVDAHRLFQAATLYLGTLNRERYRDWPRGTVMLVGLRVTEDLRLAIATWESRPPQGWELQVQMGDKGIVSQKPYWQKRWPRLLRRHLTGRKELLRGGVSGPSGPAG